MNLEDCLLLMRMWWCICCWADSQRVAIWYFCRLVGSGCSHLWNVGGTTTLRGRQWGWLVWGNPTRRRPFSHLA